MVFVVPTETANATPIGKAETAIPPKESPLPLLSVLTIARDMEVVSMVGFVNVRRALVVITVSMNAHFIAPTTVYVRIWELVCATKVLQGTVACRPIVVMTHAPFTVLVLMTSVSVRHHISDRIVKSILLVVTKVTLSMVNVDAILVGRHLIASVGYTVPTTAPVMDDVAEWGITKTRLIPSRRVDSY